MWLSGNHLFRTYDDIFRGELSFCVVFRNTASSQSKLTLLKCYFIKNAHKFVCSVNSTIVYTFLLSFQFFVDFWQHYRSDFSCGVQLGNTVLQYMGVHLNKLVSQHTEMSGFDSSHLVYATSSPIYSTLFSINWQNCELAALTCPYWFIPRFIPCHYWSMN